MVSSWLLSAVVIVSVQADPRDGKQLFSSSRFSSSGLVFPGPPGQNGPSSQRARPAQIRPASDELLAMEKSDGFVPVRQVPPQRPQQQGPSARQGNEPRPSSNNGGQPVRQAGPERPFQVRMRIINNYSMDCYVNVFM